MDLKTKIHAEEGKQDLTITREFDLPLKLLFKAHAEAELIEQWMSHEYGKLSVLKFEPKANGCWEYQTTDAQGNVVFSANGVFHRFITDKAIVRTFEMANSPFDAQLEFLEFEKISTDRSRLTIRSIYKTGELRDQMLKLPFRQGLSMAHDRLQKVVSKLK